MKILGIDPGIAITGWAMIEEGDGNSFKLLDYGVIKTEKDRTTPERLLEIAGDLRKIISDYKPDIAGIESLLFCKNLKTAVVVGEARGVILLMLQEKDIPLYEFTPLQVKSSISGYGKADKKQVQESVKLMCNLKEIPQPDDAADAIAIAICCRDSYHLLDIRNERHKN